MSPLGRLLRLATLPEGMRGHMSLSHILADRACLVVRSAASGVSFPIVRAFNPGSGLVTAACDLVSL